MSKQNRICQSCGMPLNKDPQGGGTEADGTRSTLYCSYCYADGKFVGDENITCKEFQHFCYLKMRESGFNAFLAWLFTRGMKRLDRWKDKK